MKKSYHGQKSENTKLQQQITTLKTEKTNLQQHLLDLQRRVAELELQIGHEDHHWVWEYYYYQPPVLSLANDYIHSFAESETTVPNTHWVRSFIPQ